ncbi:MAG: cell division protein ZapD [Gammaproteobacteria bacterium]|nr:cell division protein ZapD [Gammaproteobacteria bacterium]
MKTPNYFEFPLTQVYRHFLRVEAALFQLKSLNRIQSHQTQQAALLVLDNLLNFLTRIDIKSELIKTLENQIAFYQELSRNPEVDTTKLSSFLDKMKKLHRWAVQHQGKIGDSLKQHSLLSNLANKQSIQTGVIAADNPELWQFCHRSIDSIQHHIAQWINQLEGLEKSISVILRLARESGKVTSGEAPMGDFLIEKPPSNVTLLRIDLLDNQSLFPEVSAGKHRISIHFYSQTEQFNKVKHRESLNFNFSLCI